MLLYLLLLLTPASYERNYTQYRNRAKWDRLHTCSVRTHTGDDLVHVKN